MYLLMDLMVQLLRMITALIILKNISDKWLRQLRMTWNYGDTLLGDRLIWFQQARRNSANGTDLSTLTEIMMEQERLNDLRKNHFGGIKK